MQKIDLNINVFDEQGNMTGETRPVSMEYHAIAAIIDYAVQISIMGAASSDLDIVIGELEETLETYDVMPTPDSDLSL